MRERILEAAMRLIRTEGPAGATARLVCDAAGIKAPTLYYYFRDMDALREEVVDRAFAHILGASTTGWRSSEGIEGLKRSWDAYLSFADREPAMFAILANRIVSGPLPKTVFDTLAQFEAALSGPSFEGRLRYPAARSAHILWAAAQGAGCLVLAGQAGVPISPDLGQDMFDTVMASLLPSGAKAS